MKSIFAATFALAGLAALPFVVAGPNAPAPSAAARHTTAYKVDSGHSSVIFCVKHMGAANFYGRFNEIKGEFGIDDHDPAASTFSFTVNTDSIDTNGEGRDKHLKSEEFFNTGKYPEMTFTSKSVKQIDAKTWEVAGELKLLAETKPLTVKFEKTGEGKGRGGAELIGLETTFTVKRSEWGMAALVGPLGDDVKITVAIEAAKQ